MRLSRVSSVVQGAFSIQWIGQAGFVFTLPTGFKICIDPYFSNSIERLEGRDCRRMWFSSIDIESFRPDVVLCSHDHLDHTDPDTLPLVYAYSDAVFYGPPSSLDHMRRMKFDEKRLHPLVPDHRVTLGTMSMIPKRTYHTGDSLGFLFTSGDMVVYFTGDTSLDASVDFLSKTKVDVLIACVNGKYGNLTVSDALELYKRCQAEILIPMHFGLIPNNTVSIDEIEQHCSRCNAKCHILDVEAQYLCEK